MSYSKEELSQLYKSHFQTDHGQIILRDLENIILKGMPYSGATLDVVGIPFKEDVMLREGARLLLNYIYYQLGNDNN